MKKILTASLVAMMAVSAARAEIASVKYVDDADKVITNTIGTVAEGTTVVQMIAEAVSNAGSGAAGALTDAKAYTDQEVGKEATARGEAISAASAATKTAYEAADTALETAYKAADTQIRTDFAAADTTLQGNINTVAGNLADEVARAKAAEKVNADAIAAINNSETGIGAATLTDAKAYTDQEVGKEATARGEAISAASAATKTAYEAADTALETAYKAADTQIRTDFAAADTTLQGNINTVAGNLADEVARAKAAEKVNADAIAAINNSETGIGAATLADAKAYTDEKVGDLADGQVAANTGAISAMDTAYKAADTALDGKITAMDTAYKAADTTLQGNINTVAGDLADYESANDTALAGVKATAEAAQVKSTAFSIGSAEGKWTAFTAIPGYCETGTCSLTTVNGAPTWVLVK